MPELPEVETVRRALAPLLSGKTITRLRTTTATLRTPLDQELLNKALQGQRIVELSRRAKYLFLKLTQGRVVQMHLGMTGSYRVEAGVFTLRTHDRIVIELDTGESLVYNDIRKFGEFRLVEIPEGREFPEKFDSYAPEPLSCGFTAKYLFTALSRISAPIKTAIMRQELVVGVGNIYANEALFAAGISPLRPAQTLAFEECGLLVREIKKVLKSSLKSGGTTISDFKRPDGSEGKFALKLKVYGRTGEQCKRRGCSGIISKLVQTGRSTFYCPECQR